MMNVITANKKVQFKLPCSRFFLLDDMMSELSSPWFSPTLLLLLLVVVLFFVDYYFIMLLYVVGFIYIIKIIIIQNWQLLRLFDKAM